MKKVICTIINIFSGLLIAAALLVLLTVFFTKGNDVPSIFGYSSFRVLTGSMSPTVEENDMILVKIVEPDTLKKDDIITFYSSDPQLNGTPITHRIVDITEENGSLVFYTKGDANIIQDEYPVSEEQVIGRLVFVSSLMGKVISLASNPLFFVIFIIIPLVLILAVNLIQSIKIAKQAVDAEELETVHKLIEDVKKEADSQEKKQE